MAVPNTITFSLQDVVSTVNPTTDDLVDSFDDAILGKFDSNYGPGDESNLLQFRNYDAGGTLYITDANFNSIIATCLAQEPVTGLYNVTPFGTMPNWDVSRVTDFSYAFENKNTFNADISSWNTGNGTVFQGMFKGASAFNQDIGSWDLGNAWNTGLMFYVATSFNQIGRAHV